jgi:hypothetical protein
VNEFPTIRGSVRWALRRWRARLRRDGAVIALFVLLLFGVGEPLLCIIHCNLWLSIAFPSSVVAHHHHLDSSNAQLATFSLLTPGVASILAAGESPTPPCFLHSGSGSDSNLPFPVSPTPVHEMIPPLLLLLVLLLLVILRLAAASGYPPLVFIPPSLRPPISFAG